MDTSVRNTPVLPDSECAISWSAVIAGALVAFSLSALFNLLNTGLGLVTFPNSFVALTTLSIGGYIWLILCGIIAMYLAGYVAGSINRHHHAGSACGGWLHGFLAWSLALLLFVIIASHFAQAGAHSLAAAQESTNLTVVGDHAITQERAVEAANMLGGVTLGVFFSFLLGAIAAGLGGYMGAKRGR
jgi:hypothetical protein